MVGFWRLGITVLCFSFLSSSVWAQSAPFQIKKVSDGLYRANLPDWEGMQELKKMGIHTIINLVTEKVDIEQEKSWANSLGIGYISKPISSYLPLDDNYIVGIADLLKNDSLYPLLVHCRHGEDRTGLIIGLHRIRVEHVAPAVVWEEMLQLGFHTILYFLKRSFVNITGYNPPSL